MMLNENKETNVAYDPHSASGSSLEERVLLTVFRAFPVSGSCLRRSGENPISQSHLSIIKQFMKTRVSCVIGRAPSTLRCTNQN